MEFETHITDARAGTFGVYTTVRQFTTLDQHNAQCYALHIGVNLSQYSYIFQSKRDHHEGIIFFADGTSCMKRVRTQRDNINI
jgi:hypothetical protein